MRNISSSIPIAYSDKPHQPAFTADLQSHEFWWSVAAIKGINSRHDAVIGRIVELKAETATRAIKIILPDRPSVDLPDGVLLRPGLLTVSFASEQQLLERLVSLGSELLRARTTQVDNVETRGGTMPLTERP